jgi:hypothetical protein
MGKIIYQIVDYDRHNNPVVLASGLTKDIAIYGLDCDGVIYRDVRWSTYPVYDQQSDTEVFRGVLVK